MNGKTIKHLDTYVKNGKLFLKIQESRSTRLRSGIILDRIHDIGNIKPTIRWVDPNADRKRFWLGKIDMINDSYNVCNTFLNQVQILRLKFERLWILRLFDHLEIRLTANVIDRSWYFTEE